MVLCGLLVLIVRCCLLRGCVGWGVVFVEGVVGFLRGVFCVGVLRWGVGVGCGGRVFGCCGCVRVWGSCLGGLCCDVFVFDGFVVVVDCGVCGLFVGGNVVVGDVCDPLFLDRVVIVVGGMVGGVLSWWSVGLSVLFVVVGVFLVWCCCVLFV